MLELIFFIAVVAFVWFFVDIRHDVEDLADENETLKCTLKAQTDILYELHTRVKELQKEKQENE